jgi:pimeloyl-ACP methyl ester carboxylesterase
MEAVEFGRGNARTILLIPGNMMTWHQFDELIPLLAANHHVVAVSTDGFDERTTFTTAKESAWHVEDWLLAHGISTVDLVFGESFGSATAAMMLLRQRVAVHSMILNGPQHMSLGPLNTLVSWCIPRNQHRLVRNVAKTKATGRFPWLLKA